MKLYRYMSYEELMTLVNGVCILNDTTHSKLKTNSKGFCFIGSQTEFTTPVDGEHHVYMPLDCFNTFMRQFRHNGVLVELEVDNTEHFKLGYGIYDAPYGADYIQIQEYSIEEYSTDIAKIKRFLPNGDLNLDGADWIEYQSVEDILPFYDAELKRLHELEVISAESHKDLEEIDKLMELMNNSIPCVSFEEWLG